MDLAKVRKAVVAAVGVAVIVAGSFGLTQVEGVGAHVIALFDAVVGILLVFGVFQATNDPPTV